MSPLASGLLCHLCHVNLTPYLSLAIKITSTMLSMHIVHHCGCCEMGGKVLEDLWMKAAIEYNYYCYITQHSKRYIHEEASFILLSNKMFKRCRILGKQQVCSLYPISDIHSKAVRRGTVSSAKISGNVYQAFFVQFRRALCSDKSSM